VKDKALYKDHHINSAIEAEKILKSFDYPTEKIEAECVASADAMAHIQNVPALLYSAYIQRGMDIDEGTQWLKRKLERSWNKLIPEAQDMARDKYEAALKILS